VRKSVVVTFALDIDISTNDIRTVLEKYGLSVLEIRSSGLELDLKLHLNADRVYDRHACLG
jgi:hypothetical protein